MESSDDEEEDRKYHAHMRVLAEVHAYSHKLRPFHRWVMHLCQQSNDGGRVLAGARSACAWRFHVTAPIQAKKLLLRVHPDRGCTEAGAADWLPILDATVKLLGADADEETADRWLGLTLPMAMRHFPGDLSAEAAVFAHQQWVEIAHDYDVDRLVAARMAEAYEHAQGGPTADAPPPPAPPPPAPPAPAPPAPPAPAPPAPASERKQPPARAPARKQVPKRGPKRGPKPAPVRPPEHRPAARPEPEPEEQPKAPDAAEEAEEEEEEEEEAAEVSSECESEIRSEESAATASSGDRGDARQQHERRFRAFVRAATKGKDDHVDQFLTLRDRCVELGATGLAFKDKTGKRYAGKLRTLANDLSHGDVGSFLHYVAPGEDPSRQSWETNHGELPHDVAERSDRWKNNNNEHSSAMSAILKMAWTITTHVDAALRRERAQQRRGQKRPRDEAPALIVIFTEDDDLDRLPTRTLDPTRPHCNAFPIHRTFCVHRLAAGEPRQAHVRAHEAASRLQSSHRVNHARHDRCALHVTTWKSILATQRRTLGLAPESLRHVAG